MAERKIALLEAAVSCGSPTRGTEGAYDALVARGLSGEICFPMEKLAPCESWPEGLRHLDTVMAVCRRLREKTLAALEAGLVPVTLGGDHSITMGTLAALGEHYGAEHVAVVYIDGHTDINTEKTSVTGYIHGMDLAAACGLCCGELTVGRQTVNVLGENIHIIGARSIDPPEYGIMEELGVDLYPAEEVLREGIPAVLDRLLPRLEGKRVHVSFDVDSLDPAEFSATGYLLPGGLTMGQAEELMTAVLATGRVCSFECVEYNPLSDPHGEDGDRLAALLNRLIKQI